MIIVIPFTGSSDYTGRLSRDLAHYGGLGTHRLVVVAASGLVSEAQEFLDGIKGHFLGALFTPTSLHDPSTGTLFRVGMTAAAAITPGMQEIPNAPVLWLEPGFSPTRREWASDLSSEFFNLGGGVRVLGTWVRQPDYRVGNGSATHIIPGGFLPEGPVVFPTPYLRASEAVRSINNMSPPWRSILRGEIMRARADSALLEGGLLSAEPPEPKAEAEPAPVRRTAARARRVESTEQTTS